MTKQHDLESVARWPSYQSGRTKNEDLNILIYAHSHNFELFQIWTPPDLQVCLQEYQFQMSWEEKTCIEKVHQRWS